MFKTRPALVIGLGGTGQWVLTYIKRDLQEAFGQVPPNVRLICMDTETEPTARADGGVGSQGAVPTLMAGGQEVSAEQMEQLFGKVRLDSHEYKYLGANVKDYVQAAAQGAHPHVSAWFAARWFLEHMPGQVMNLKDGAAAWRQFGRLAVYYDVRNPAGSVILAELRRAMQQVQAADTISAERSLEVLIICSLVGGTGAGMAIDIANLIKSEVAASVRDLVVRGFFVLPRAFGAWREQDEDSTKKRARAFAAWRELDRFRVPGAIRGLPIRYGPAKLDTRIQSPPFDVVYLVDGARGGNVLEPAGRPEWHVFPSVADFVGVILDDMAGKEYSQRVINLNQTHPNPREPRYSTLGTYTFKSPVYYVMLEQSHHFCRQMTEILLRPVPVKGRKDEWVLAPDQNAEDKRATNRERRGKEAVVEFLNAPTVRWTDPDGKPHEAHNTKLLPAIAAAIEEIGTKAQQMLIDWVQGALLAAWWENLTDLGTMEGGIPDEDREALEVELSDRVFTAKKLKEPPADSPNRFDRQIPEFYQEFYGGLKADQRQEVRGRFGEALKRRGDAQVDRFTDYLCLWVQRILMGEAEDVREARGGKLGFALDFVEGLAEALDKFQAFLRKVTRERQNKKLALDADQLVQQRETTMRRMSTRKFLLFFTHPKAYTSQDAYLRAWQERINVRKDDLFYLTLSETVEAMQLRVAQMQEQLQRWANVLIGNPNLGYVGLYRGLEMHLDQHSVGKARDSEQFRAIQRLFDFQVEQGTRDELLKVALKHWRWDVRRVIEGDRDQLQVSCRLDPIEEAGEGGRGTEPILLETRAAAEGDNVERLVEFARQAHQSVWARHRMARLLLEQYAGDEGPRRLVEDLFGKAEPLYETAGGGQAGALGFTQWLRANWQGEEEQRFFDRVERELAGRDARFDSRKVPSVDPYRLTLTRTDDLIPSRDFKEWEICSRCYESVARDYQRTFGDTLAGRLMHILPAEGNALRYELAVQSIGGRGYEPFHPLVVAGLENVDNSKLFFWSLLLDYLQLVKDDAGTRYQLRFPLLDLEGRIVPDQYRPEIWLTQTVTEPGGEQQGDDIFWALANFSGWGEDVRRGMQRKIDYGWLKKAIKARIAELGESAVRQRVLDVLTSRDGLVLQWFNKANVLRQVDLGAAGGDPKAYEDLARLVVLLMVESAEQDYQVMLDLGEGGVRTNRLRAMMKL